MLKMLHVAPFESQPHLNVDVMAVYSVHCGFVFYIWTEKLLKVCLSIDQFSLQSANSYTEFKLVLFRARTVNVLLKIFYATSVNIQ